MLNCFPLDEVIMHKSFKLLLMAVGFLTVALMGASTAQASRGISLSATTIGASGSLTMNSVITCDVLLSLTANSNTLTKTTGTTQATANGGYIRNCTGSLAGNPATGAILGPINIQYRSFAGTLPNITKINILAPNAAFSLNTVAGLCLYAGSLDGVGFDVSGGAISSVNFNGSSALAKSSGGLLCPSSGSISGLLTGFLPSAPTVTLI
jgi:hypothetical protein